MIMKLFWLIGMVCFSACCQQEQKTSVSSTLNQSQSMPLLDEEPAFDSAPVTDLTEELTVGLTFAEKWQEFQRLLTYRSETELIYYAEGLLLQVPRADLQKRMELNFFLQNAYIKKGQREKAGEYGTMFLELQKQLMSGTRFREHIDQKKRVKSFAEKWSKEDHNDNDND